LRNKPPESFLDFTKIIFSTENCSFLVAEALARPGWKSAGSIEFNQFRIGTCHLDSHVKRMMRGTAATAKILKLFLGLGYLLFAMIV